jgi:uncharacterized protein YbjQ (UPF0145 family)
MLVVTTENIPGYEVKEVKGACFGLIVKSRGLGADLTYLHQKSSTSSGGRMNGASDEGWLSSSRKADIFLSIY